ncbi:hypothetical protein LUZ60_008598 [Juncus effusus]|nr:hypothetical protein LUZ60_008598 [Juncus effusus]
MSSFRRVNDPSVLKPETNDEQTDRLSSLPDSVLTEILSLLKAREMVQTCILSSRWRNLWASVPCLDVDISEFRKNEEIKRIPISERECERFQNFIGMFLQLRDNSIDVNSLCVTSNPAIDLSSDCVKWGILYALRHNVKKLSVRLFLRELVEIPDCLFISENLESLEWSVQSVKANLVKKIKAVSIRLPILRYLKLRNCHLDGNFLEMIIFGCPVLESLYLINCRVKVNEISSRSLEILMFDDCVLIGEKSVPTVFTVCAPNVRYLVLNVFVGSENMKIAFEGMSNVPQAWIEIDFWKSCCSHVLSGLPGLVDLDLHSEPFMEMLEVELPELPIFKNLKKLCMGNCCMACAFGFLAAFLRHCPNLENLSLMHVEELCEKNGDHGIEENDQNSEQIERFCCEHLKTVELAYLESDKCVHFLLKCLRRSTKETVEFILDEDMQ